MRNRDTSLARTNKQQQRKLKPSESLPNFPKLTRVRNLNATNASINVQAKSKSPSNAMNASNPNIKLRPRLVEKPSQDSRSTIKKANTATEKYYLNIIVMMRKQLDNLNELLARKESEIEEIANKN
jgi:hypothetical protein